MRIGQKPRRLVELDDVDRKVVALLQEDGRRAAADIARVIGTATQTVSNRIERLVSNAVLDIMAILNPPSVGYEKDAIICMRVLQGYLTSVGDRLADLDFVSYVGFLSGSWDIMIEVYVEDDAHLFRFLTEDLAQIQEITATETWTVLETRKFNYAWSNPLVPSDVDLLKDSTKKSKPSAKTRSKSSGAP